MTTETIETETMRVESESVTYCDGCGRYGEGVELVTLAKDPTLEARDSSRRRATRLARNEWHYSHRQGDEFRVSTGGEIDACRRCLLYFANESEVLPVEVTEPVSEPLADEKDDGTSTARVLAWFLISPLSASVNYTVFGDPEPFRDEIDYVLLAATWLAYVVILGALLPLL